MFQLLSRTPPTHFQIAANLRRLGWIGFWCQLILGSIPVILLTFQWIFSKEETMTGIGITNIFSFIDIMTLLFTIFWCFGYTRPAKKLENSEKYPKKAKVLRNVWIGITANLAVMFLAVLIGVITLGRLLYTILSLPQGATTILQDTANKAYAVHSWDVVCPSLGGVNMVSSTKCGNARKRFIGVSCLELSRFLYSV
ncbi:DUF3611 family protein [Crocosphaera sp. Alani8]|uniref:DUF3611 family protein n=1 Tax=Crocosphaera sp. Alani8 TaxID=3038952 RepID=UPI00313E097A